MKKAVILDADGTLWKLQALYDDARERFLDLLESRGVERALARARTEEFSAAYIDKINPDTGRKYLYTAARLPASFEATLRSFIPAPSDADVNAVRALANSVFKKTAASEDGVEDMLTTLKNAGYFLVVLTKGEEWVQKKRLNEFAFIGLVDDTIIVPEKTKATFEAVIKKYGIDPARSFSLGDSVGSDVIPADAAGLNTIWFSTHTWSHETKGALPQRTRTVYALAQATAVILSPPAPDFETIRHAIVESLSRDLLSAQWRKIVSPDAPPVAGHCAVAAEAFYHLTGGAAAGMLPVVCAYWSAPDRTIHPIKQTPPQGSVKRTHWWVRGPGNGVRGAGEIHDLTAAQYEGIRFPYERGRGCGFQQPQKIPSRRAQLLIDRVTARLGAPALAAFRAQQIRLYATARSGPTPRP